MGSQGTFIAIHKLRHCFRKHPEILAVYAFGSVVKGTSRRSRDWDLSSDLDLGILFDERRLPRRKHWDRQWKLYSEFGKDLKQELDLVILNGASLGLVHQILRTGKRIYERPGRRHRREEAQLLIEALDFLPTKEWIEHRIIQQLRTNHG